MCSLIYMLVHCHMGFPGGSVIKNPPTNAGDVGSIPGLGRSPGKGNGNTLQHPCLKKSHGYRSLAGKSPWHRRELSRTQQQNNNNMLPHTIYIFLCLLFLLCTFRQPSHTLGTHWFCDQETFQVFSRLLPLNPVYFHYILNQCFKRNILLVQNFFKFYYC